MSNWRKGVFNTTCKYGHILAGDNLRITTKRRSFGIQYERVCRACHAIHSMEYWLWNTGSVKKV